MTNAPQIARMRAKANRAPKLEIRNKAAASAEIAIYDEIGAWGITSADFMRAMAEVKGKNLTIYINSPGGDVFDGVAILNQLRRHDGRVDVVVDGLAASAASFIAMAGETVTMSRNSQLMIHDASGLCLGNAQDMAKTAELLDQVSDNIAAIYAERAGGDAADWRETMRAETWYTASEAVDAGLADVVDGEGEDPEVTNRFDLSIFAHAGRSQASDPLAADGTGTNQPPVEPGETTTTEGVAVSDTLKNGLAQRLGINASADELTEDKLLEALDEALSEQTTPETPQPEAPAQLPDGVVAVDKATLDQLKADAAAGREAKTALDNTRRQQIVDKAISDGKVAPARREHWLNQLAADEQGITEAIDKLEPVFNTVEAGFTGGVENHNDNDDAYPASWKE